MILAQIIFACVTSAVLGFVLGRISMQREVLRYQDKVILEALDHLRTLSHLRDTLHSTLIKEQLDAARQRTETGPRNIGKPREPSSRDVDLGSTR
jgi:hypothetical protein